MAGAHPLDRCAAGGVVARVTTDTDGTFRVAVARGSVLTAVAGMSRGLMDARVTAAAYSKVDFPCDTGVR